MDLDSVSVHKHARKRTWSMSSHLDRTSLVHNPCVLIIQLSVLVSFFRSGGWTLVTRVQLTDGSLPSKEQQVPIWQYREQLQNYNSNNHVLTMKGFMNLRADLGFEQMRFYCHKKIPGKVFHVTTKTNPLGEAVIQYFTGNTTTPPRACDSFSTFPDDNSTLSRKCAEWGATKYSNSWGRNKTTILNMCHRLVVWKETPENIYVVAMCNNDYFCEDTAKQGSPGDEWKVYVR